MSLTLKPQYQTALAAGLDLPAAEFTFINAGETVSVDTGLTLDDLLTTTDRAWPIPSGCILEAQIRGRSGLAFKHKVTAFHGTIDLDYKQTIKVLLTNNGKERFEIHPHDRIAQLVFGVVYRPAHLLTSTERKDGFGSTGT
jgi:dUTP pyrophosphatase